MPDLRSFTEVLNSAIEDMLTHGFDNVERVERWMRELRAAAERSMVSPASLEQTLRDGLARIYRRLVDEGQLLRHAPGVQRFTLDRIRPALRSELDRRIAASASLIKLNREQAIDKTLQRFSGWSTSLPKGGTSAESKAAVRKNAKKAMASLPFEERRVLIDQGHKLTSSLSQILATDGGAIAGAWRSHWRQPGYNYREDHKERDGKFFLVRGSWADREGLVKGPYYDEVDATGQAPFCRCYMVWKFNLRDLPAEMLTAKGKRALAEARERAARTDDARADSASDLIASARRRDLMGFLRGIADITEQRKRTEWHAEYLPGNDEIRLYPQFERLGFAEQMHVFLHEVGHRGQDLDPAAFREFKRAGFHERGDFLHMANEVHLADLRRRGKVDGLADEVFAESYSRFVLGLELPDELARFWHTRRSGLRSKADAAYTDVWPNRITRCARCSMFMAGAQPERALCTAIEGWIRPHGHCGLFEIEGLVRADALERGLSQHRVLAARILIAFQDRFGRPPNAQERAAIDQVAAEKLSA